MSDEEEENSVKSTWDALKKLKESKKLQSQKKALPSKIKPILNEPKKDDDFISDELNTDDFDSDLDSDLDLESEDDHENSEEQSAADTWAALKALKEKKQANNKPEHKSKVKPAAKFTSNPDNFSSDELSEGDFDSDEFVEDEDDQEQSVEATMAALKALKNKKQSSEKIPTLFEDDDELSEGDFESDEDEELDDEDEEQTVENTWDALRKLKEMKQKKQSVSTNSQSAKTHSGKPKTGRSLSDLLQSKDTGGNKDKKSITKKSKKSKRSKRYESLPEEQRKQFEKDEEDIMYYAKMLNMSDPNDDLPKGEGGEEDPLDTLLDGLNLSFDSAEEEESEVLEDEAEEWNKKEVSTENQQSDNESIDEDDDFFDSSDEEEKKPRENPYLPGGSAALVQTALAPQKYIPPHLKKKMMLETSSGKEEQKSEEYLRLQRQIKGRINRLAESTITGIINNLSDTYIHNPRQHVNEIVTSTLLEAISLQSVLSENFLAIHAALIAALYRSFGLEFAAYFVQTLVESFDAKCRDPKTNKIFKPDAQTAKQVQNLVSLLAELYSFNVVSCGIIYDFFRQLMPTSSESSTNDNDTEEFKTELILRIIRSSGAQLRTDDSKALKDIVLQLQTYKIAQTKAGKPITARTNFMISFIEDLKNNKSKGSVNATDGSSSDVVKEARKRMRNFLNTNVKAAKRDPLRVSLQDIRDVPIKGKWWLIGSAWRSSGNSTGSASTTTMINGEEVDDADSSVNKQALHDLLDSAEPNWMELAKQQRMNTDIRKAIFISIMSSRDYVDAVDKLQQLKLSNKQESEIVKILLHCCTVEVVYNPFYALVAARICNLESSKLSKIFTFSLFDFLSQLENEDSEDENTGIGRLTADSKTKPKRAELLGGIPEDEDDDGIDGIGSEGGVMKRKKVVGKSLLEEMSPEARQERLRKTIHMAKLYGTLVAYGALPLTILKTANLVAPSEDTMVFLDLFFVTLIMKVSANGGIGMGANNTVGKRNKNNKTSKLGTSLGVAMFERKLDPSSERGLVQLIVQTHKYGKGKKNNKSNKSHPFFAGRDDYDDDDEYGQGLAKSGPGAALLQKIMYYLPSIKKRDIMIQELETANMRKKSSKKAAEKVEEQKKQIEWGITLMTDSIKELLN